MCDIITLELACTDAACELKTGSSGLNAIANYSIGGIFVAVIVQSSVHDGVAIPYPCKWRTHMHTNIELGSL